MTGLSSLRALAATLLLLGGAAAALLLGAPLAATLMALFSGAGAIVLLSPGRLTEDSPPVLADAEQKPKRPTVRDFIEAFPEPVLVVRDRRVAIANDAARAVLGARIEGEDVRLAIRHPAAAERLIDPASESGGDDEGHAELVGLGEAERRWTMTVARLADGARLVRLEDRSSTHAAEKMRTDFVANASHELRTPLATLLGFIETLEDLNEGDERDTRLRFLAIMNAEARRMQRLIDDLMSLSRIEADRFSVPREAHDLLSLVEQARDNQRFLSEERGNPIVIDAPENLPAVAGDRSQLLQMVDNLLANALKYGRPGTPVTATIGCDDDGLLLLSIADQGDGISREHLPRITERFYRVDASRSRAAGGTGLGLSIVKHVVERHRGRLHFDSEVGRGTTVQVALPAEPPSSKSHETIAGLRDRNVEASAPN